MKSQRLFLFLVAASFLVTLPATAQDAPAGEFDEEVSVNEVLIDVVVTDKQGNVILGLDQDDFIVEEQGDAVDVTSSTFYSNRQFVESSDMAARLGIDATEIPVDRYFILFFHDQRRNLPALTSKYLELTRRAEDWLFKELLPNDWVAVVRYDAKLMVHTDFTTDNERILKAIKAAAIGKRPPDVWPSRMDELTSDGPSLLTNLAQGKDLQKRTRRIYSGLEELAEAAGYITGRKNLMLFTMGFGEVSGLGTYNPDQRYYPKMMHSLNDNNVAVYSISVTGSLASQAMLFDGYSAAEVQAIEGLEQGMSLLADDTGGQSYFNFVNFETPLAEVLEDNNGYYLLSYQTSTPIGESGYRKVTVKAKNPDFEVKARQGYRFGQPS